MYESFFGLQERPFSITPDPRYLYLGKGHRDALAHLLFSIEQDGGFVMLSGEVGTGKTTLSRALLEQLPDDVDIALILNPRLTAAELVASICDELGVGYRPGTTSIKVLVDALNRYLIDAHGKGRRTMVVLDEAQNLSVEVLEQVRLLTNLETSTHKLLRMVLIGQSEIVELLSRRELRQLSQRITARNHLDGLNLDETRDYIRHRLGVAGASQPLFSRAAIRRIYKLTSGTPRLINVLCDRSLLGAYAHDQRLVTPKVVDRAAREVGGLRRPMPLLLTLALAASVIAVIAAALLWLPEGSLPPVLRQFSGANTPTMPLPAAADSEPEPDPAANAILAPQPAPLAQAPLPPADAPPATPPHTATEPAMAPAAIDTSIDTGSDPGQGDTAASSTDSEPPPSIEQWLEDSPQSYDQDQALRALLALWGVKQAQTAPCDSARAAGLRCLAGSGDWQRLRSLGLPAVLQLQAEGGQPHYALLQQMDDERVTLRIGDHRNTYWLNELEGAWGGRFIAIWRPPEQVQRSLFPGHRGSDVAWVQRSLNRIDDIDQSVDESALFNAALQSRVRSFQLRHGLTADGIVGEKTLIHLSTALPDAHPRLTPPGDKPNS